MARFVCAIALFLLFIWLAVSAVHDYRLLVRAYTPLPFWDDWITVDHFLAYKHLDLSVFLQQHNEHRIVFPELIFAVDDLLFHDRLALTTTLSCLSYLGTWCLLAQALLSDRNSNLFANACAILTGGIVIAWAGSTLVLGSPFQIVWTLLFFAAAAALGFLASLSKTGHSLYCPLAISCAVVAAFSEASGLAIWPVLIVAASILRLSRKYILAFVISAAISIGLYFTGYQFAPSHFGLILRHPLSFISFTAAYLSVPFGPISASIAICAGLVNMIGFVCLAVAAWRKDLARTRAGIVLLGFYLIVLFTALMTAVGRMDPNNPSSIGGATAHRYIVIPLLGWAALMMIAGWILDRSKLGSDLYLWGAPLAVMLVALFLTNQTPRIKTWLQNPQYTFFSNPQIAALSLEAGLEDSGIITTVTPIPDSVIRMLPLMKQYRLSVFAGRRYEWIGKPASQVFTSIYPRPQAGAITVVHPVESGLELVGWSESQRNIFHPEQLVFLNEEQRIVGLGSKLPDNLPDGFTTLDTPAVLAWVGFANRAIPSESVTAYKIGKDGRTIYPLGESVSLKPLSGIESIAPKHTGPALPVGEWTTAETWRKNGSLPDQPHGEKPNGDYFDDWNGGNTTGGELVSPLFKISNGCITIPIAHGPPVTNLKVRVTRSTDSMTLASIPILGADQGWRYWQMRIPGQVSTVRIVATDFGREWNEWMALGQPLSCR